MKIKTSIIFIPGIYHSAWCWQRFTKYFEDRGYHTDAVTLFDSHHSSKRVTLKSYFDIVERAIDTTRQINHGPVILVGHSKGGGLVECFIAKHPNKVDGAILMSALPLRRAGRFVLSFMWRHISSFQTMQEMIALLRITAKLAQSKPIPSGITRRCALFSSRISPTEAEHYATMLAQEPFRPSLELAVFALRPLRTSVPVYTIGSTGDHVFSPWEQELLAGAYSSHTIVLPDLCHDMMLDPEWQRAAEATLTLVEQIEHTTKASKL